MDVEYGIFLKYDLEEDDSSPTLKPTSLNIPSMCGIPTKPFKLNHIIISHTIFQQKHLKQNHIPLMCFAYLPH